MRTPERQGHILPMDTVNIPKPSQDQQSSDALGTSEAHVPTLKP